LPRSSSSRGKRCGAHRCLHRQAAVERDGALAERVPLLRQALAWVGHAQTRNRGTIGGSLAHADPCAELPLAAQVLGARTLLRSSKGKRTLDAASFFTGAMSTAIRADECLEEIEWPVWRESRTGAAFHRAVHPSRRFRRGRRRGAGRARRRRALRARGLRAGRGRADAARLSEAGRGPGGLFADRGPDPRGGERAPRTHPSPAATCTPAPNTGAHLAAVLAAPGASRGARKGEGRVSGTLHLDRGRVNGKRRSSQVPARLSLVDWLRDELRLTGTHVGCEHGVCGACSVMLDGEAVRACLMYAVQAHGHRVTTVEGLTNPDGAMTPLQDAFLRELTGCSAATAPRGC
jgi:hypothetical protein